MALKDCVKKIRFDADDKAELSQLFKDHKGDENAAVDAFMDGILSDLADARAQLTEQGFEVALPESFQPDFSDTASIPEEQQASAPEPVLPEAEAATDGDKPVEEAEAAPEKEVSEKAAEEVGDDPKGIEDVTPAPEPERIPVTDLKPGRKVQVIMAGGDPVPGTITKILRAGPVFEDTSGRERQVPIEDIDDGESWFTDPLDGVEETPPQTKRKEQRLQFIPAPVNTALTRDLRAQLDKMNLKRVHLDVADMGEVQGAFLRYRSGQMRILIGASLNPVNTVNHEAVHALRAMNLFTPAEWVTLENEAAKTWLEKHDIVARYPDILPSEQIEEAIAEEFAEAATNKKAPSSSALVRAFNKIQRFLKALRNALNLNGFHTVEDVFGRMESGEVGAREGQGAPGSTERYQRGGLLSAESVQRIQSVAAGKGKLDYPIALKRTPEVLKSLDDVDIGDGIFITQNAIEKAVFMHGISVEDVISALNGLDAPIAVFDSKSRAGSTVSLVKTKSKGRPLVLAIHHGKRSGKFVISEVSSLHAKDNKRAILSWIDQGLTRYLDRRDAGSWFRSIGLQLPKDVSRNRLGHKILRHSDVFKPIAKEQRKRSFSKSAIEKAEAMNETYGDGGAPLPTELPFPPSFPAPKRTGLAWLRETFQDRFILFRAAEAAIAKETGDTIPESMSFSVKETVFNGRTADRLEKIMASEVRPLTELMRREGVGLDDMGMYLIARHAPERNALMKKRDPERFGDGGGSGLTDEAAVEILKGFDSGGQTPKLARVAKAVDAILKRDLDLRHRASLITGDQYQDMQAMYQHYVPLRGFAERDDGGQMGLFGTGFDIRGKEAKTAFGRYSLSENPVVQTIAMRQEGVVRTEKNRVGRALLRLVKKYPNPEVWQVMEKLPARKILDPETGLMKKIVDFGAVREDEVLAVKVEGEAKYIQVKDPILAASVKNLDLRQAGVMAKLVNAISRATRAFSRLQTGANPDFVFPNGMSDLLEGVWTSYNVTDTKKMMRSYLKNYPIALYQGISAEFQNSRLGRKVSGTQKKAIQKLTKNEFSEDDLGKFAAYREEWESAGGKINFMAFRDLDEITRDLNKEITRTQRRVWQVKPWEVVEDMLAVIEKINQPVESAGRLAMYIAARENGLSKERAAALSLDSSGNYYRRGRATRSLAALYAFFNPAVQGVEKFVRFSSKPRNMAVLGMVPISAFTLALYNMKRWEDEEDPEGRSLYLQIPEWERSRSLIIPTGVREDEVEFTRSSGKTETIKVKRLEYLSFRVPHNLRPLLMLGDQMAALQHAKSQPDNVQAHTDPGDAAREVTRAIAMNNNPFGAETPWNALAPTVLDPFVDLTLNRNFFGSPIRPPEQPWTEGMPASSQYFERSTSPVAVAVAQTLNRATGGGRFEPGKIDVYPNEIEYLFDYMTGGLGRFVSRTGEAALNVAQGVDTKASRKPIVRTFSGETTLYAENDLYYQTREELFEMRNQLRAAKKAMVANPKDEEARTAFVALMGELNVGWKGGKFNWKYSLVKIYERADENLKGLREDILTVMNDDSLERPERIKKIDALRLQIEQVQKQTRRRYVDFMANIASARGSE